MSDSAHHHLWLPLRRQDISKLAAHPKLRRSNIECYGSENIEIEDPSHQRRGSWSFSRCLSHSSCRERCQSGRDVCGETTTWPREYCHCRWAELYQGLQVSAIL